MSFINTDTDSSSAVSRISIPSRHRIYPRRGHDDHYIMGSQDALPLRPRKVVKPQQTQQEAIDEFGQSLRPRRRARVSCLYLRTELALGISVRDEAKSLLMRTPQQLRYYHRIHILPAWPGRTPKPHHPPRPRRHPTKPRRLCAGPRWKRLSGNAVESTKSIGIRTLTSRPT